MNLIGELAGLTASFLFAFTAVIYTNAGRAIGSQNANRLRLIFALLYLLALNWFWFGEPLPFSAGSSRWLWLGASGVVGLALGDAFLFQAFVCIGARLGSLLLSLAPIFGAFIAWAVFGETLTPLQIIGVALTVAGVSWVVASHKESQDVPRRNARRGVLFGLLSALGQAGGMVLSRQGMAGDFPPFQAGAIRMAAAAAFIWIFAAFQGEARSTLDSARKHISQTGMIALGAMLGPVLGVTASLLAVQRAEVGVASALTALQPVMLLPIMRFVFHEEIGWQAVVGTLLAACGVAALFLA